MSNLYKRAVRAAFADPELRPLLLPLLKEARESLNSNIRLQDLERILAIHSGGVGSPQGIATSFDVRWLQRPQKYVIEGQVTAAYQGGLWVVPEVDLRYDPRVFQRFVMEALHRYSQILPGEVSVKAKRVKNTQMNFVLTGVME